MPFRPSLTGWSWSILQVTQHDGERNGPARPTQASSTAPQVAASGYRIALRRNGPSVEITLTADNDYAGMELYDSLLQSVKSGHLRFEIALARP
jgi:hypothetical protein